MSFLPFLPKFGRKFVYYNLQIKFAGWHEVFVCLLGKMQRYRKCRIAEQAANLTSLLYNAPPLSRVSVWAQPFPELVGPVFIFSNLLLVTKQSHVTDSVSSGQHSSSARILWILRALPWTAALRKPSQKKQQQVWRSSSPLNPRLLCPLTFHTHRRARRSIDERPAVIELPCHRVGSEVTQVSQSAPEECHTEVRKQAASLPAIWMRPRGF